MKHNNLKKRLESIYTRYHSTLYIDNDPISCVRRFDEKRDQEIAGLISSSLAYGRINNIIRSLNSIFIITGDDLSGFVMESTLDEKKNLLKNFRHRFNSGEDMALLMESVKHAILQHGTVGNLFRLLLQKRGTLKEALTSFSNKLKEYAPCKEIKKQRYFEYLLPSPKNGSACKRLNLYLRWMIRKKDGIDLGVWEDLSPEILIIPLDVHIIRAARYLGMTSRSCGDWKMAEQITEKLAESCPEDPVKYDFSLCRYSMVELN